MAKDFPGGPEPWAEDYIWCVGLVSSLSRSEFSITADHHVRLARLCRCVGRPMTDQERKTAVRALVVKSRDQAVAFEEACGRYVIALSEPPIAEPPPGPVGVALGASTRRKRGFPWKLMAIGLGLVAAVLLVPSPVDGPKQPVSDTAELGPDSVINNFPPPVGSTVPAVPLIPDDSELVPPTRFQELASEIQLAILLFPLLVLSAFGLRHWRWRRAVAARAAASGAQTALSFNIPPSSTVQWPVDDVRRASRAARQRQEADAAELDVRESIRATIAAQGLPSLVYASATRPPEYLILVERTSARDHLARYYELLADRLREEDVIVHRYWYQRDPRRCFAGDGRQGAWLDDIHRAHPDARLIIIGTGRHFVDPLSGNLAEWTRLLSVWDERTLLTTIPRGEWGTRENAIRREFLVLPASLVAFEAIADHREARLSDPPEARKSELAGWAFGVSDSLVTAADLRRYMGGDAGFAWLCACAVYPELRWDLTMHLAQLPPLRAAGAASVLVRLARLPWFLRGSFPDHLRLQLLDELERLKNGAEVETSTRETLVALLASGESDAGSPADRRRRRELALNRMFLYRDDPEATSKLLASDLRQVATDSELARDVTVVRLMSRLKRSRLTVPLPRAVERLLFTGGQRTLAARAIPVVGGSVVAAAAAVFAVQGAKPLDIAVADLRLEPMVLATIGVRAGTFSAVGRVPGEFSQQVPLHWERRRGRVLSQDVTTTNALGGGFVSESRSYEAGKGGMILVTVRAGAKRATAFEYQNDEELLAFTSRLELYRPLSGSARNATSVMIPLYTGRSNDTVVDPSPLPTRRLASQFDPLGWIVCGNGMLAGPGMIRQPQPGWGVLVHTSRTHQRVWPFLGGADEMSTAVRALVAPLPLFDFDATLARKVNALKADTSLILHLSSTSKSNGSVKFNAAAIRDTMLRLGLAQDRIVAPSRSTWSTLAEAIKCVGFEWDSLFAPVDFQVVKTQTQVAPATPDTSGRPRLPSRRSYTGEWGGSFGRVAFTISLVNSAVRGEWIALEDIRVQPPVIAGQGGALSGTAKIVPKDSAVTIEIEEAIPGVRLPPVRVMLRGSTASLVGGPGVVAVLPTGLGDPPLISYYNSCEGRRATTHALTLFVGGTVGIPADLTFFRFTLNGWHSTDSSVARVAGPSVVGVRPGRARLVLHCVTAFDTIDVEVRPPTESDSAASLTAVKSLRTTVYFDFDKSDLNDAARSALDAWAAVLQSYPWLSVDLIGHTAERGSAEYNLGLGARMATSAKSYMVGRGVAASRLRTQSMGEGRPTCTDATEQCSAANRRVEISVRGSAAFRP